MPLVGRWFIFWLRIKSLDHTHTHTQMRNGKSNMTSARNCYAFVLVHDKHRHVLFDIFQRLGIYSSIKKKLYEMKTCIKLIKIKTRRIFPAYLHITQWQVHKVANTLNN